VENGYIEEQERLERQGKEYQKDIERAKFHEERGKIKCDCSQCQLEREIHNEVQAKIKKERKKFMDDYDKKWGNEKAEEYTRAECANCYEEKQVSVDSGLCRKCEREEGRNEDK
jgi:ribosomal protein S14